MSKHRYIVVIALLLFLYNALAWQHALTGLSPVSTLQLRLYYTVGLVLFLLAVFFTYMLEKKHQLANLATALYIVLFLSGAPFLYRLVLYIILNNLPAIWP